jgi:hypothetical protein
MFGFNFLNLRLKFYCIIASRICFEKFNVGTKKMQKFMLILNLLMSALKNASLKIYRQNAMQMLGIFVFAHYFEVV